ncbi:pimeloyl-ACP methyl ester esterase BioH [Planctobacterium marinum]|uniref:Pimeloyl-[acyl-carrier protein] methyl ester esterase n=1 Tax=Planctobacterium marinum TaxID=1631968 RepID=A0AA48HH57_9ALTE|nr:pimeloyl-[acyl-carrier protein] methyl ester esterase [Planctobacterium marinum]
MQLKVQDFNDTPDLVLLHGWGVNSGVFSSLIERLEPLHRLRLVDLPGFGMNNHVQVQQLSFPEYCQLIQDVIPAGATVAGWSLGGLVAQHIALQDSTPIARQILICSSPCFLEGHDWPGIKQNVLQSFQQQLKQDYMKTLERFLAIQAMGSATAKADLRTIREQVKSGGVANPGALERGLWFLQTVDLRAQLATNSIPTLRIFGGKDSLVPEKSRRVIELLHPGADYHTFDKASHAPFISHTDQFVKIFNDFLLNI